MTAPTSHQPLRFVRRAQVVQCDAVPPDRTLLDLLREDLHHCGTKEGCGSGDCGACVVVTGEADAQAPGGVRLRAVNSCIRLAHSIHGMALWTVEDLTRDPLLQSAIPPALHPAQQAMVDAHGSQCGFCTPGFVMSLFALYHQGPAHPTRHDALHALSGNLCRCTGYRPIVQAACAMAAQPQVQLDFSRLLQLLEQLRQSNSAVQGVLPTSVGYQAPTDLPTLLALRASHPQALVAAGTTDVGLWISKQLKRYDAVLDVTRCVELRQVETTATGVRIGAAVPLQEAFAAMVAQRPQLAAYADRFAGLPVRQSGTLGGNVANGSPIGDSMPLLIALGATVTLMAWRQRAAVQRSLPLQALYLGYRKTALATDELLTHIDVPAPTATEFSRAYKVSKRFEDDISAVALGFKLELDAQGVLTTLRVGAGGVAALPARATATEHAMVGQPWSLATAQALGGALADEFAPLSDLRASADYRRHVLRTLPVRLWHEWDAQRQGRRTPLALEAADATALGVVLPSAVEAA
jgi:xanthine dehydrogenase small subunit